MIPVLPQNYTHRSMRTDDVPALVDLLNREALFHGADPEFSQSEYAVDLGLPGFDLERDSRVVLSPKDAIAGLAELHSKAPHVRPFAWVHVEPEHDGRGLGSWLLRWSEAGARERLEIAPSGARVALATSEFETNAPARAVLENLGFQHVRTFYRMGILMDAPPPATVWPAGVTLRTMDPDVDDRAVYLALDEAFADHWGHVDQPIEEGFARWQYRVRNDPSFDPTLHFIAEVDGEIAGVAVCGQANDSDHEVGRVHQLAVRRPWRKRGLGRALLLHTFAAFYARGAPEVALGVDAESLTGATRLYESAGMTVRYAWVTYEKELRAGISLNAVNLRADE